MESQVVPPPQTAGSFLGVSSPPRRKTRRERLREELLNAPNLMTIGRVALIPVFLALLSYENRRNSFLAAVVFAAAALTDWLDGWLARVSNKVTTLGKFLDPMADKIIVLSALVMLVRLGRVPVWVVVLILARELLISGLRTLAISEGLVISASRGGKWKTSLQLSGIIALMVHSTSRSSLGWCPRSTTSAPSICSRTTSADHPFPPLAERAGADPHEKGASGAKGAQA